jgi:hypothetical protein
MSYRPRRLREKPTPRYMPRYIIEYPDRLTPEAAEQIRQRFAEAVRQPGHIVADNGLRIRRWR